MSVGPAKGPSGGRMWTRDHFSMVQIHNDIVESFIAMQIIFAEIFVPQDFTIRLLLGSVDPQTCVLWFILEIGW